MDENRFIITASTDEVIDLESINPGDGTVDCNAVRAWGEVCNSSRVYDLTNGRDILNSEFVFLPNFPSKVISYERMVEYGKDKYYWDALAQFLYTFGVTPNESPFKEDLTTNVVGVTGNPALAINAAGEFSKDNGVFNEVILDENTYTTNYITVEGHPSLYAEKPYLENTYYYDSVGDKWYLFVSNYTMHINNLYYDRTIRSTAVLKFDDTMYGWRTVGQGVVLSKSPNVLLNIVDTEDDIELDINTTVPVIVTTTVDIDKIDKTLYYLDASVDKAYLFDYGTYFHKVDFTGTVYERAFDFYRELQDVYLDVNETTKINTKDIYYTHNHPELTIKEPSTRRVYYDSYNQKYYVYNEEWVEVPQEHILVPQSMFPYTHGDVKKSTL